MFDSGIAELIESLLKRNPFETFSVEMIGGETVKIARVDQARIESEAGLLYLRDREKNQTTVIVLSRIAGSRDWADLVYRRTTARTVGA